jgi:hypothetical protein
MSDAMGDELPNPNPAVGSTGHIQDHIYLRKELVDTQAFVQQLLDSRPRILGTVTQESSLPLTGQYGEMWLVGNEGDLWAYDPSVTPRPWTSVGNISGPQGLRGVDGTVVGILGPGENPPAGTPAGTLWFQASAGETLPPPELIPTYVGGSANAGSSSSLSMTMPSFSPGDIAVLACVINTTDQTSSVSQTGWNEVTGAAVQSGSLHLKLWTKTLQAGDGNFTVNKTGVAVRMAAAMMIFRNVQLTANQPHKWAYRQVSSGTSNYAPPVTPTVDSIVCGFWLEQKDSSGSGAFTLTVPTELAGSPRPSALTADTSAKAGSAAGAYSLTVAKDAARPTTAGDDWVRSIAGTGSLGLYTVALQRKVA